MLGSRTPLPSPPAEEKLSRIESFLSHSPHRALERIVASHNRCFRRYARATQVTHERFRNVTEVKMEYAPENIKKQLKLVATLVAY